MNRGVGLQVRSLTGVEGSRVILSVRGVCDPPSCRLKITPRRRRKRTWESGTLFIKTSWTFTHAGCKPTLASKIAARSRGPLGSRDSSYIIITLEAKVPVPMA